MTCKALTENCALVCPPGQPCRATTLGTKGASSIDASQASGAWFDLGADDGSTAHCPTHGPCVATVYANKSQVTCGDDAECWVVGHQAKDLTVTCPPSATCHIRANIVPKLTVVCPSTTHDCIVECNISTCDCVGDRCRVCGQVKGTP